VDGHARLGDKDWTPIIAIVAALVAFWIAMLLIFWLLRPKGVPVRDIIRVIPDVLRLLRSVITDRSAPLDVRVVLIGLISWMISPIDLIPELIPVLGPLDDVVVAVVAMRYVRRQVGIEDLRTRWAGTPEGFAAHSSHWCGLRLPGPCDRR
jgi:uncharacterized membrane protein YkvA (DUF1232 family)